jgi:hypothetical protein
MKRSVFFFSLIVFCWSASGLAFAQQNCEFNIVGTWKAVSPDAPRTVFYRFAPDGTVAVLSRASQNSEMQEIASATYKLDNPGAPKTIEFTAINKGTFFSSNTTTIQVKNFGDTTFTTASKGAWPTRWTRIDANRYYIVFAARNGTALEGGPAFAMLVKMNGGQLQVETVGLYFNGARKVIGAVPAELSNEFMNSPRNGSDVMLRLEITSADYERSLEIVQTWQRRAREGVLLYPPGARDSLNLNNSVLMKEIVESLNHCSEKIKLYKLDWSTSDEIVMHSRPSKVPFEYVKKLRQLNASRHIKDGQFYESLSSH